MPPYYLTSVDGYTSEASNQISFPPRVQKGSFTLTIFMIAVTCSTLCTAGTF